MRNMSQIFNIKLKEASEHFLMWVLLGGIVWLPRPFLLLAQAAFYSFLATLICLVYGADELNKFSPVFDENILWYIWLIASGIYIGYKIIKIIKNPVDPYKLDISDWEDVTPTIQNDIKEFKKLEDVFDTKQYSEFINFLHQKKTQFSESVNKHQLSNEKANIALLNSVKRYMEKRKFNYYDIESVCNHIERI